MTIGILHVALLGSLLTGGPVTLAQSDAFPYAMTKTPEEGPVDPAVASRYSQGWRDCTSGNASSTNLIPCYEHEYAQQDESLNRAWGKAVRRVRESRRSDLIEAERRWIAARDPFCRNFTGGLNGSLVSIAYLDCRIELTIRRTMWLEQL